MSKTCPLCKHTASLFCTHEMRDFYQCSQCKGIFLDPTFWLNPEEEEKRYKHHNNDVEDKRYQKFVSPITSAIINDFTVQDKGLDFGAGTGPVISKVLTDQRFSIVQYDPFFHKNTDFLNQLYHYIACCEVMEHFHNPHKEFSLLKRLLLPNGKLYCMTKLYLYDPNVEFANWYYKNDPTHVFLYQEETIQFIAKQFSFSSVDIKGSLIIFSN